MGVRASGLQWAALCCSLSLRADGRDVGGDAGSSGSGAEFSAPPPVCRGLDRRATRPMSLRCFSQNPAFTLPASELLLVLFFFISDCCAQDCESGKPPRCRLRCKHMRVYLQARACVQVYPTERRRDLDPEVGFSLVLRAGLGDLQKGWSNSSSSVYILIWDIQGH